MYTLLLLMMLLSSAKLTQGAQHLLLDRSNFSMDTNSLMLNNSSITKHLTKNNSSNAILEIKKLQFPKLLTSVLNMKNVKDPSSNKETAHLLMLLLQSLLLMIVGAGTTRKIIQFFPPKVPWLAIK